MSGSKEIDFRSDPDFLHNVALANLMVLSGQPQKPVDVLCFHLRSYGDSTGLFEKTRELFEQKTVQFIAVPNSEGERVNSSIPFEANPGMTEYVRCLTEIQQIPIKRILHPDTKAFHTRQENDAFLELSKQRGWTNGVILTQPHQLLRAMLGMVQAMKQGRYQMEIYTVTPSFTPWLEVVKGNQGIEEKPRLEHIFDELIRVYRYQASGDLATFDELFDYLKAREDGTLVLGHMERGSNRFRETLPPNPPGSLAI